LQRENEVKILMKHSAGALALSVSMLSMSAGAQVAPAGKPVKPPAEVVQPAPSVDVETGQLLDRGRRDQPKVVEKASDTPPPVDDAAAPNTERGIKDQGVKSCGSCGMTSGRAAAPPPVDDAAAPGSATARPGRPKIRVKEVSTKTSSLLPVLGGVAALAALAVAVGGGNDGPTSP
jgi:hypothetical protein